METEVAVVCREMEVADRAQVVALLTKGFARWRERRFWEVAIERLEARTPPAGLPRFGYVLDAGGLVVGVLLLIASTVNGVLRCNVSSWYVEPVFRPFGTLLVNRAFRHRDALFTNVTPAPETWQVLAAQRYRRGTSGRAVFVPALAKGGGGARVRPIADGADGLEAEEVRLLREHADWGCLSVVAERDRVAAPFVFGPRIKRGIPFAYLLYCRSLDSVAGHARSLGLYLLRRRISFVVVDADGRVPGMPGRYLPELPTFFRGPPGAAAPQPGDLAYTERAVFGT